MRVLVYPRDLELGGSSINAIDLAAAMRRRGHDVWMLARPGPLAERVTAYGVPLITVPVPSHPRPSRLAIRAISDAVRRYRIDIVHTYEFWTCVEAYYGAAVRHGTPVLGTVMTMGLDPYLPHSVPLTVGYRDLLEEATRRHPAPVYLLEPPVDLTIDGVGVDTADLVRQWQLDESLPSLVIVSRAAVSMKQEGIERTIDAVSRIDAPVQLVVVGDGSAASALRESADRVNQRLGRREVILTGAMADPRPAYEFADVVVGMGGSVLRGMAFRKPAVVVGEDGFSLPVTPETLPVFDRTGFYGVGSGRPSPDEDPLIDQVAALITNPDARLQLGVFGRKLVEERFNLDAAALRLEEIYGLTVDGNPRALERSRDAVGTAARVVQHKVSGRRGRGRQRQLPAKTSTLSMNFLHTGAFSGSAPSLRRALGELADVRAMDLMPLTKHPTLQAARMRANIEARQERNAPWNKSATWSRAVQSHLARRGWFDPATPLLVVQSLPAFVLPGMRYAVYTDRVGREGAGVGGVHSSRFTKGWLDREATFLRGAARLFVMGPSTERILVDSYACDPDRISVVGAGANMSLGSARRRTHCRRLLFVGTQWDLKGGPILLDAFASLRTARPELELVLVGSAPPGPLPPGVRALGRIPHEDMDSVYDEADLLVIPTHMEAFGIALVEGLMKGLPCVCSTVGNQPWIVGDAGEAVPPGSAEALTVALDRVIGEYPSFHSSALQRGDVLRDTMRWSTVARRICDEFVNECHALD